MRRAAVALAAFLLPLLGGYSSDYLSVKRKFDLIENEKLRPGTTVTLSARELNAYVDNEFVQLVPPGVRNLKLELGSGSATGSALIDFAKVRQAQGKPPGWLATRLLGGERPVRVTTLIRSGGGQATVDVDSVEISGYAIEGALLEYLIDHYLRPNVPEAKVGTPFELGHRIDRLDVRPEAVGVLIR